MIKRLLLFYFYFLSINIAISGTKQDTYQFQYFNVSNGLPTNYVYKISQDHNKLFWFATNSGLVIFEARIFK